jgi:hypothetical protein
MPRLLVAVYRNTVAIHREGTSTARMADWRARREERGRTMIIKKKELPMRGRVEESCHTSFRRVTITTRP